MNCASARCRRASWPRSTVKRAPESLARGIAIEPAVARAEFDVVLDREIEAARRAPAMLLDVVGLVLAGRHGGIGQVRDAQHDRIEFARGCRRARPRRPSARRRNRPLRPAARTTSSPLALAWPIALLRVLRRFCNSCVRTWMRLRSASSCSSAAASSSKPRVARRRSASAAGSWRNRFGIEHGRRVWRAESVIIACRGADCCIAAMPECVDSPVCRAHALACPESIAEPTQTLLGLSPRAWLYVAIAFALGILLFVLIWAKQRNADDFYRADGGEAKCHGRAVRALAGTGPGCRRRQRRRCRSLRRADESGDSARIVETAPAPTAPGPQPVPAPAPSPARRNRNGHHLVARFIADPGVEPRAGLPQRCLAPRRIRRSACCACMSAPMACPMPSISSAAAARACSIAPRPMRCATGAFVPQ